ncbi:transketolase, thiamine diphosphate binding domain protein [Mycobacterium xenopi 4042]|uniref:Transketolase, thiamine diphosphate binding domain protein n=1 Tax=Mycobacterium xenopi 4042 TaxID=1299334 RepID=X7YPE2_MYCXE|nr:transketolase, thiamine diphosphate binding domain protein [Mycobacterium xenopi 4042]
MTSEASSLAAVQQLGNLIVFYDHNQISIEDDTNIALCEDTAARYEAYGWHVQRVEGGENVVGIEEAIANAKAVTDRPSFIELRTIIGYPAPNLMNTGKAHGAALGEEEVAATKKVLGFDPDKTFEVRDEVLAHTRKLIDRGRAATNAGSPSSTHGPARAAAQSAAGSTAGAPAARRLGHRLAALGARFGRGGHP